MIQGDPLLRGLAEQHQEHARMLASSEMLKRSARMMADPHLMSAAMNDFEMAMHNKLDNGGSSGTRQVATFMTAGDAEDPVCPEVSSPRMMSGDDADRVPSRVPSPARPNPEIIVPCLPTTDAIS